MRSSFVRHALVLPALALLLASCDVEGRIEGFPTENPLGDVETVEVTPDSVDLEVGAETELRVEALDESGNAVGGVEFLWEVIEGNGSVSVNAGNDRVDVTGTTPGRAEIRASAGAVASDTAVVIVVSPGQ